MSRARLMTVIAGDDVTPLIGGSARALICHQLRWSDDDSQVRGAAQQCSGDGTRPR
jgi:hypothetical protein